MAGRFRFRLEPLLRLRRSLEQEAQRALARQVQLRNVAAAELDSLLKSHEEALASRRVAQGQPVDVDFWRAVERWLVVLEKRTEEARQALAQAETRVGEARQALTQAHQAHRMLLRLKERRQEQHAQETFQEELRLMDELAVLRHRFNAALEAQIL